MKTIRLIILRFRLWLINASIRCQTRELYLLNIKEMRLEKKFKALGGQISE